jgi:hypothetical protein
MLQINAAGGETRMNYETMVGRLTKHLEILADLNNKILLNYPPVSPVAVSLKAVCSCAAV